MEKCYILLGPEKGLKEDFIKEIKNSLKGCDISKFYGFEDYESEMYAQLNNNDLFASHKLVILDEAQEIKTKDKIKALKDYILNPSDCATLLILSDELYISSEIMNAVPNANCIQKFFELFENKKTEWIQNFFRRNGMFIDIAACNAIIERVDNNISEFQNVCSQIIICCQAEAGKTRVGVEDVEDFLVHTRKEDEFTLFSYLSSGKLDSSIECLHAILNSEDASYVAGVLPSKLAVFFRRALSLRFCIEDGASIDEAFKKKFFDSDRNIVMPKDKDIYKKCLSRYTTKDIERILVTLCEYDTSVKENGTVMAQTVLEKCIVDIICHKGKHQKMLSFASL